MADYGPGTYGDHIASVYDRYVDPIVGATTSAAVEFLAARARGGRVLELGIGTGRVALPLLERGLSVHGIDASQAMLDRLRAKPGAEHIAISVGDFADVDVEGRFDLVY